MIDPLYRVWLGDGASIEIGEDDDSLGLIQISFTQDGKGVPYVFPVERADDVIEAIRRIAADLRVKEEKTREEKSKQAP